MTFGTVVSGAGSGALRGFRPKGTVDPTDFTDDPGAAGVAIDELKKTILTADNPDSADKGRKTLDHLLDP